MRQKHGTTTLDFVFLCHGASSDRGFVKFWPCWSNPPCFGVPAPSCRQLQLHALPVLGGTHRMSLPRWTGRGPQTHTAQSLVWRSLILRCDAFLVHREDNSADYRRRDSGGSYAFPLVRMNGRQALPLSVLDGRQAFPPKAKPLSCRACTHTPHTHTCKQKNMKTNMDLVCLLL